MIKIVTRDQARQEIRARKDCRERLEPSKSGLYCCKLCESGHGEKGTGAVEFYPKTNTWFCHACKNERQNGRRGDYIDLYMIDEGVDYNTALQELAEELNLTIEKYTAADARRDFATRRHYDTPNPAAQTGGGFDYDDEVEEPTDTPENAQNAPGDPSSLSAQENPADDPGTAGNATEGAKMGLPDYTEYYKVCRERLDDPGAAEYITGRGISINTAKRYYLGYDPKADPASAPGAMGNEYKPHPAPRIIIPSTPWHYVGRRIDGGEDFAKLNSKGTTPGIFNSKTLYKQDVGEVFVLEGTFDALSVIEAGRAAIALNSAGNGQLLIERLKKQATAATLILCPDNDSDTETAERVKKEFKQLKEGLEKQGVTCIIADINAGQGDANDALVRNRAGFYEALQAAEAAAWVAEPPKPPEAAADQEQGAADQEEPQRGFVSVSKFLPAFMETIQTTRFKPFATGLNWFDDLLDGGLERQGIMTLLAAPAAGKTTLCQQISEAAARRGNYSVYVSMEMSQEQMLAKTISGHARTSGINAKTVLHGYEWTDEQRAEIMKAAEKYREKIAPYMMYLTGITELTEIIENLKAIARSLINDGHAAPLVIIDYLHLITDAEARGDAQELVKRAIVALKNFAIEFNTCVIAIGAVNRDSMKGGRITINSGRDSSAIEYTGDSVISLNYYDIDIYRPAKSKPGNADYIPARGVHPDDLEKVSALQQMKYRRMVIRILKGRLFTPGKTARVYFHAAGNTFYGENDFLLLPDDEITPFDKPVQFTLDFDGNIEKATTAPAEPAKTGRKRNND